MSLSQPEVRCHASFPPTSPSLAAQEKGGGGEGGGGEGGLKEESVEERGEDGRGGVVMGTDMERALCE